MSKIVYPIDGIYSNVSNQVDLCKRNLNDALSNSDMNVPSFNYKNYLDNLPSVLASYCNEMNSIENKLKKTTNEFENLSNDLESNNRLLNSIKIKERDRMIY